jgi:hypothetical protein
MKHQKDARNSKDDKKKAGNASQTEGIREPKAMALHLRWEDVEEKGMIHHHGSLQFRIRYSSSENGPPHGRF